MNDIKLFFINSSNCYRLNSPCTLSCRLLGLCTLSCRGPRTQLQNTRPLCTQLQSLILLYDPKLNFRLQILHYASIPRSSIDWFHYWFTLSALLYLYNPMVHGPWVDLYSRHYITKLRVDKPMAHLQAMRSVPTKCRVFILGLQFVTKIWALSPETFLGGSHTQQGLCIGTYLFFRVKNGSWLI